MRLYLSSMRFVALNLVSVAALVLLIWLASRPCYDSAPWDKKEDVCRRHNVGCHSLWALKRLVPTGR